MPLLDRDGIRPDAPITAALGEGPAVAIPNTLAPAALAPHLATLEAIAIPFPSFGDGRGFSLARALREAGYRGRLRATGELIPDQFAFALDCGFDEVEVSAERLERQPPAQWRAALDAIGVGYQPTGRTVDIFARRRAARAGSAA